MLKAINLNLLKAGEHHINTLVAEGVPAKLGEAVEIPNYFALDKTYNNSGLKADHVPHIARGIRKKQKLTDDKKVIFVYPANSQTAAIKPSLRKKQGSSGLAEVYEIDGIDNAGIPTITSPGGAELASQEEIEHYIAQLYALAAQGHQLVFSKFGDYYAFGGDVSKTFKDSSQDKFMQGELAALEAFLHLNEDEANAAIIKTKDSYKEAFQRGLTSTDKNPDSVFQSYGTKSELKTGNADTFKFKDLKKLQNFVCNDLKLDFKKKSDTQYVVSDKASNKEIMLLEPHRIIAVEEKNDVAFYEKMIRIGVANSASGKKLYFYAAANEKANIDQAVANLKTQGIHTIEVLTDYNVYLQHEAAAKQAIESPSAKSSATPPSSTRPPSTQPPADPFQNNLLVQILLKGNAKGYEASTDKAGKFIIITPDTTDLIIEAFTQLGLKNVEHYNCISPDGDKRPFLRITEEALPILKNSANLSNPKSPTLEQAIEKLEVVFTPKTTPTP
jgi:hypothetical protein